MPDDDLNYAEMRERVEKRVRKRAEFLLHLVIYIPVNILFWVIFLFVFGATQWLLIPLVITMGWTIGLIGHAADTYLQTGALDKMREREMRREIALERMRRGLDDEDMTSGKRKRQPSVRLSDDGELVSSADTSRENFIDDSDGYEQARDSSSSRASRRR